MKKGLLCIAMVLGCVLINVNGIQAISEVSNGGNTIFGILGSIVFGIAGIGAVFIKDDK